MIEANIQMIRFVPTVGLTSWLLAYVMEKNVMPILTLTSAGKEKRTTSKVILSAALSTSRTLITKGARVCVGDHDLVPRKGN